MKFKEEDEEFDMRDVEADKEEEEVRMPKKKDPLDESLVSKARGSNFPL